MLLQNGGTMKKLHFYIPSKPPFDKGRLVASLHYSCFEIKMWFIKIVKCVSYLAFASRGPVKDLYPMHYMRFNNLSYN